MLAFSILRKLELLSATGDRSSGGKKIAQTQKGTTGEVHFIPLFQNYCPHIQTSFLKKHPFLLIVIKSELAISQNYPHP